MKVGIAVQFFKESPAATRCLIREKVLEPEAETTAWFLELISKWYKLMSSRHPSVALSCRDMAKYHAALDTLCLALETIQGMQMGSTSQWKPSQAGLMTATTVVSRLQDVLLKTDDYKFFLTGRLLQDCLENLFFCCGAKGNPFQTRLTFHFTTFEMTRFPPKLVGLLDSDAFER
ncbi:hypothetical protein HPB49_005102 [Dermacentor silvarum]|uniref:Uncharacterized protein n=1 Tax=Dermacentor silvarum TaxID=543639 RepID=A0ACB8CPV7_DERSI|nr:hypothetical protein HPB49_005102 [Dermacentor silvarum]